MTSMAGTKSLETGLRIEARNSLLDKILNPAPEFQLLDRKCEQRSEAEQFVREKFLRSYGASVDAFHPWLLYMRCLGKITAVIGMRPAGASPLFLEQYLDSPVESALEEITGRVAERDAIVELGNLVALPRGSSHILFLIATSVLRRAGYRWIVFTATRPLLNNLSKLGFETVTLGEAEPERLETNTPEQWGSYYDTSPVVAVGNLDDAMSVIRGRSIFRRIQGRYANHIGALAERFRWGVTGNDRYSG